MPYIGNDLRANNDYKTIDDISSSFNGSTTSFALLVNGVAPTPFPKLETQLIISVGGVIQQPDVAHSNSVGFKISGSNIVFSSAPASGEAFFGIIFATADYLNAGGLFPDGTATVPSITFSDDTDTGLFRSGSGLVSVASNGVKIATFPSGQGTNGQALITDGAGVLSFGDVATSGGATGGGTDKVFQENSPTVTTNYTIGTTFGATANALSAGPITINAGVTVTVPSGSVLTIV